MGLLDEAIREHLDLKRRRGADPSEIARLEHEALGPVRREPFRSADRESGLEELREPGVASDRGDMQPHAELPESYEEEYSVDENTDDWREALGDEDVGGGHGSARSEALSESDLEPADESPLDGQAETDSRRWRRGQRASSPGTEPPPGLTTDREEPEDLGDGEETAEYSVEDALTEERRHRRQRPPADPSPEDEDDVLEKTPEFLQDAPEHDRLWFEQRPPRDFDFDD